MRQGGREIRGFQGLGGGSPASGGSRYQPALSLRTPAPHTCLDPSQDPPGPMYPTGQLGPGRAYVAKTQRVGRGDPAGGHWASSPAPYPPGQKERPPLGTVTSF